ncbi:MAG: hypothetical protein R2864_10575 [Syntrophotaleaceae bacterium]
MPVDLLAGVGFIAVFAGATKHAVGLHHYGGRAFRLPVSDLFRHGLLSRLPVPWSPGIYLSQRIGFAKGNHLNHDEETSLRKVREERRGLFDRFFKAGFGLTMKRLNSTGRFISPAIFDQWPAIASQILENVASNKR